MCTVQYMNRTALSGEPWMTENCVVLQSCGTPSKRLTAKSYNGRKIYGRATKQWHSELWKGRNALIQQSWLEMGVL